MKKKFLTAFIIVIFLIVLIPIGVNWEDALVGAFTLFLFYPWSALTLSIMILFSFFYRKVASTKNVIVASGTMCILFTIIMANQTSGHVGPGFFSLTKNEYYWMIVTYFTLLAFFAFLGTILRNKVKTIEQKNSKKKQAKTKS